MPPYQKPKTCGTDSEMGWQVGRVGLKENADLSLKESEEKFSKARENICSAGNFGNIVTYSNGNVPNEFNVLAK